jgi:hypothetical protein
MYRKTILLALILAFGLVTSTWAQQSAPNTNPTPTPAIQQPGTTPVTPAAQPSAQPAPAVQFPPFDPFGSVNSQQAGYPAGFDDGDGWMPPPPPSEPTPQNPVQKAYENGKIVVIVGTDRHFGYRIGDKLNLAIIVAADPDVKVDFNAIGKGIYGLNGSDFESAGPARARVLGKKNGKIVYRIDLQLRTFVYKDGVTSYGTVFTADFLYATEMTPDGKVPNWKRLTTPEFDVTRSNTADNGENLLEGDLDETQPLVSWFTYPLLLAGLSLVMLWPVLAVMEWVQRVRPRRQIPANELAWSVFDRVIVDGKSKGFTVKHYKQIAAGLRVYLGVEAQTLDEAAVTLKDHKDFDEIMSALSKFDSVLYDKGFLTEAELRELTNELKTLVPRP